jgi:hypothetical protein
VPDQIDRQTKAAEIYATLTGVCAGFTFTATLFIIQTGFITGSRDFLLSLMGASTIVFVFSSLGFAAYPSYIAHNMEVEKAKRFYRFGRNLAVFGLLVLTLTIIFLLAVASSIAAVVAILSVAGIAVYRWYRVDQRQD